MAVGDGFALNLGPFGVISCYEDFWGNRVVFRDCKPRDLPIGWYIGLGFVLGYLTNEVCRKLFEKHEK